MKQKEPKKNRIFILSFVILVSFSLLSINIKDPESATTGSSFVGSLMAPLQSGVTSSTRLTTDVFSNYFWLVDVAKENEKLRQEISKYKKRENELLEKIKRYERIAQLLKYSLKERRPAIAATVIGRDATQWSHTIFLDKGADHGVQINQAVASHEGVVGHVMEVMKSSSKVLLILDNRSAMDALLQNSRVTGVVQGTGQNQFIMKYVPKDAPLTVGEPVITSGLGGIYPKGLKIGEVVRANKTGQGLFQEITLSPSADFNRLENVLILSRPRVKEASAEKS